MNQKHAILVLGQQFIGIKKNSNKYILPKCIRKLFTMKVSAW